MSKKLKLDWGNTEGDYESVDAGESVGAGESVDTGARVETAAVVFNHRVGAIKLAPIACGNSDEQKGLVLLPGENQLTKEAFDHYQTTPACVRHTRMGDLAFVRWGVAFPILRSLDGVSFAKARELISAERDINQIRTWIQGTKNAKLLRLLKGAEGSL